MSEAALTVFMGTRVVTRGVFNSAGSVVAADPTAVAAKIRKPDGSKFSLVYGVAPEMIRISAGVYELRYVYDMRGDYHVGFSATQGITPVVFDEIAIHVRKPASTT